MPRFPDMILSKVLGIKFGTEGLMICHRAAPSSPTQVGPAGEGEPPPIRRLLRPGKSSELEQLFLLHRAMEAAQVDVLAC